MILLTRGIAVAVASVGGGGHYNAVESRCRVAGSLQSHLHAFKWPVAKEKGMYELSTFHLEGNLELQIDEDGEVVGA